MFTQPKSGGKGIADMLTTPDSIRTLQRKLYRKAKQEPVYRFHALYDKVYRADILSHAYNLVHVNKGSAGIDGVTFEAIETGEGVSAFLAELEEALRNKTYKPDAVKRVRGGEVSGLDYALRRAPRGMLGPVKVQMTPPPLANLKYVDSSIVELPKLYLKENDLLFNRTNSYELVGKTGIFRGESDKYTFASYLIRIRVLDLANPHYVNFAMNSPFFRTTQIEPEITQQCGQANFNGTKLVNSLIPLPPLAEQRRIISKGDQLMALCDGLEARLKKAKTKAGIMTASVVQGLVAA